MSETDETTYTVYVVIADSDDVVASGFASVYPIDYDLTWEKATQIAEDLVFDAENF